MIDIHETAIVDAGAAIGDGTRIWHWTHVRNTARIGRHCSIGQGCYIDADVVIGDNVKIQNGVSVYKGVLIESDVFVGPHVCFTNDLSPRSGGGAWSLVGTTLRRGASLGAHSTILCGVDIGEWAMVGAGSMVTCNVAKHALVRGNPARHIGYVCKKGHTMRYDNGEYLCEKCHERVVVSVWVSSVLGGK